MGPIAKAIPDANDLSLDCLGARLRSKQTQKKFKQLQASRGEKVAISGLGTGGRKPSFIMLRSLEESFGLWRKATALTPRLPLMIAYS